MVCLLAILLYTGQNLPQKDHFVVTTSEYNTPSYHIYEANHEQPFPTPDRKSGIYRTSVNINGPGTYITVYCSISAPISNIREFVSNGLTPLPSHIDRKFGKDEKAENECFENVYDLYLHTMGIDANGWPRGTGVAEPVPLLVSQLINSSLCTKRLLISLAYQRRVLCAAGYGFQTTYSDTRLPTIIFDEPVEIADAIYDGQFVMQVDKPSTSVVLVWNQGQLQIFTRYDSSGDWTETIYVGNVPFSGWQITELIKSHNAQVRGFMNEFAESEDTKSGTSKCLGIQLKAWYENKLCRKLKLKNLRVRVDRLDSMRAGGNIARIRLRKPIEEDERRFIGQIS